MKRFFEQRYGIVIHWTLRKVTQPEIQTHSAFPIVPFHENIIGLVRWIWWEFVAQRFFIRHEFACIPMSHDVLVLRCGPWILAFRRAGAKFQKDEKQHSHWLPVRIKLPFFDRIYRGGWLNEYMGKPPLEDIAEGCENPKWYEPT